MASTRVTVGSDFDSGSDDVQDHEDDYLGGSDSDGEDGEGTAAQDTAAASLSGITDVMAKILSNAAPRNKGPILAKGQTDKQIRRRKKQKEKEDKAEGEPAPKKKRKSEDGEGSSSDWSDDSDEEGAGRKSYLQMQKRKEWNAMGRVKPSVLMKEKERRLQKIATRGVVQIFNVVRQQQSLMGQKLSEAGPSVRRRDKVMGAMSKKQFLDLLDHTQAKGSKESKEDTSATQDDRGWSILRDDYMMKASMKAWDRDDDDDNDGDDDNR